MRKITKYTIVTAKMGGKKNSLKSIHDQVKELIEANYQPFGSLVYGDKMLYQAMVKYVPENEIEAPKRKPSATKKPGFKPLQ